MVLVTCLLPPAARAVTPSPPGLHRPGDLESHSLRVALHRPVSPGASGRYVRQAAAAASSRRRRSPGHARITATSRPLGVVLVSTRVRSAIGGCFERRSKMTSQPVGSPRPAR